jgi:hypothetical protein
MARQHLCDLSISFRDRGGAIVMVSMNPADMVQSGARAAIAHKQHLRVVQVLVEGLPGALQQQVVSGGQRGGGAAGGATL